MDWSSVDRWFLVFLVVFLLAAIALISKLFLMALTRIYQDIRDSVKKLEENLERAVQDFRKALHGVLDGQQGSSHYVAGIDNRLSRLEGEHERCLESHDAQEIHNRIIRLEGEFNACRQERIYGRRSTDYPRDGIPHLFMTREVRKLEEDR